MALSADLDYALQIVAEPGWFEHYTAEQIGRYIDPTTTDGGKAFWADAASHTIMLYPLQLRPDWINTNSQLDSIVGYGTDHGSGVFNIASADATNQNVFEANLNQNPYNPWIFHAPASGISGGFIAPPANSTIFGRGDAGTIQDIEDKGESSLTLGTTILGAAPPFPGAASDVKCIAISREDLAGNQPLYLRWYQPAMASGHQTVYGFMIGQYCVVCQGALVQLFLDTSAHGDRTAWTRKWTAPLFAGGTIQTGSNQGSIGTSFPNEFAAHDRALFWLPYRRHYVYLQTSFGHWRVFPTHTFPQANRLSGLDNDWDITESRKLSVWCLSQSAGRFQVQKIKWKGSTQTFRTPVFTLDYAPLSALGNSNIDVKADAFHGSTYAHSMPVTPPGYNQPINELDTCTVSGTETGAQTRRYGFTLSLTSSADQRWTPFLYGLDIEVPARIGTWPNAPTTVSDTILSGHGRIRHAMFTSSLKRGEGRLDIDLMDFPSSFATASQWYRSDVPIRLYEGLTNLFVGLSDPVEMTPLRFDAPRVVHFKARDLWKLLSDSILRDQRDWGPDPGLRPGQGHIFVVDFVARQAGIDTTGADYPKLVTDAAAIGGSFDWALGGVEGTFPQWAQDLKPSWKPNTTPPDTAASFIERIAMLSSGWDVGFYPDGQFFYRPKDYYTTTEAIFSKSHSGIAPRYFAETVEFLPMELEANVLQVQAFNAGEGSILYSSVWVDWPSILNPLAPNFIGRWKPGFVKVDGAFTCTELNRIARILWQQARRARLLVKFRGEYYQPLKVGHCLELEGYADQYRLQNFRVEKTKTGWAPAYYEAMDTALGAF